MAHNLINGAAVLRPLLFPVKKINLKYSQIRHGCMFCRPPVPWLEKPSLVFSKHAIMHHYGVSAGLRAIWFKISQSTPSNMHDLAYQVLPIIIISVVGFGLEIADIIRNAVTRDDVWYTKNPAACEVVETRKGYPPPIRKWLVYNQKYENPPGLIEALQGDTAGPSNEEPEAGDGGTDGDNDGSDDGGSISAKTVAAHAIVSVAAVGVAAAAALA